MNRLRFLLCVSLVHLSYFILHTAADGAWGTSTRQKRAAEREFTLPNYMTSDSARTSKSFEELQEEARAQERVDVEVESSGYYDIDRGHMGINNEKKGHREKKKKVERATTIESFLVSLLDAFEEMWQTPDFANNVEIFISEFVSEHFDDEVEADRIQEVLLGAGVLETIRAVKNSLILIRQLLPTISKNIVADLSPRDLHVLLSLDLELLKTNATAAMTPKVLDFAKRIITEDNLDVVASTMKDYLQMLGAAAGGRSGLEAMAAQLKAQLKGGGGIGGRGAGGA